MPGVTVDGNDVLEVFRVTNEAVKRAREGGGPTLIDAITCRWHGHYEGDPQVYRKEGDLEEWMKKDPILRLGKKLFEIGVLNKEGKKEILDRIEETIMSAEAFAESSPYPQPEDALKHVYC
jgi:TPP-dependent pyruvate/acetoin dehydrogenase alpha subunit